MANLYCSVQCLVILMILYIEVNALKLKPISDAHTIQRRAAGKPKLEKGEHVCSFLETKTKYESITTTYTKVYNDEVCCKHFFGCWKKCQRPKVLTKTVTKLISKLVSYKSHRCCEGWSYNATTKSCNIPVCTPYCRNNGLCKKPNTCDCLKGFTGKYCQLDINECEVIRDCDQDCINLPGSYQCACKKGYVPKTEDSKNCTDFNECKAKNQPCRCASNETQSNVTLCRAECVNLDGDYQCVCPAQFVLASKNICVDRNECFESPDICDHICVNTYGGYECKCFSGFKYDKAKKKCLPIDACANYNGGCEEGCVSVYGGYVCTCPFGLFLSSDKHTCIDINECKESMSPCEEETSTCENYKGGYQCLCTYGFRKSADNLLCNDRDECTEGTSKCDQKCINTFGSYKCGCNPGYKLDSSGYRCLDINECELGNTYCSQRCENTMGSYSCACNPGYILSAIDKKRCIPGKCENILSPMHGKAICNGYVVGRKCRFSCKEGYELHGPANRECGVSGKWSGPKSKCLPKRCSKPKPPLNGKVTLPCDIGFGSTCPVTCKDGYIPRGDGFIKCDFVYGELEWDLRNTMCEEILVCKPNPCLNNGKCSIVTDTEYFCNCTNTGHTGKDCEILVVSISPIPKLKVGIKSQTLTIEAKPVVSVEVKIYPEDPDIIYNPNEITLESSNSMKTYTVESSLPGLKWVSYDTTSTEEVKEIPDSLLFFASKNPLSGMDGFTLLSKNKDCFNVAAELNQCPSSPILFSSTALWESRVGGIVSTNGLIYVTIKSHTFPLALAEINSVEIFMDMKNEAELLITEQPKSSFCTESQLTDAELQYSIRNDVFARDFIAQYNHLTPDWFNVNLDSRLKNIHRDNIHAFVWPSQRIKAHSLCNGAAIDDDSIFLVYLHHEQLTLKVHDKNVVMKTKMKFCFLIDICKLEPHLVIPPDNYGTLETVLSFAELQTLGWNVTVKTVGFRKSSDTDNRKCKDIGAKQVAFGTANVTYAYKNTISGGIQGNLFVNLINNNGKEVMSSDKQCFDGKSRFDTPVWFTTDYIHKRYTKVKPVHNSIQTKASKPSRKHMFSVLQGKNAIFKVKTGLKAVLKTSQSSVELRIMYKDGKKKPSGDDDNWDRITSLEGLTYPLSDLEAVEVDIQSDSLAEKFSQFVDETTEWNAQVNEDLELMQDIDDDSELILSKIRVHYFKLGPYIENLKKLIPEMKGDGVDSFVIKQMESALQLLTVVLSDLKKYSVVDKPSKVFQYLTLNFVGQMCLLTPCMDNMNITLYPASHDLGLNGFCSDATKGPNDIWQAEVVPNNAQLLGNLFKFDHHDKMYLCLSIYGVQSAIIHGTVKFLGTEIKDKFVFENKKIVLSPREMKVFQKYKFMISSTVNLELGNWKMADVLSHGDTNGKTDLIKLLQKHLDNFTVTEYAKIITRTKEAQSSITNLINRINFYENSVRKHRSEIDKGNATVLEAEKNYKEGKRAFEDMKKKYDEKRAEMVRINKALDNVCTETKCPSVCNKFKQCKFCQKPYQIEKLVPSCSLEIEDRSYGFAKSDKSVCSHVVEDRGLKYTGNCPQPNADSKYAQSVIDQLNEKIKNNEPLTLEDAYSLETVNPDKGRELREQLEKKNFFDSLGRRLQNGVLTDEDFYKLETYTNKTFADKMRKQMNEVHKSIILRSISKKIEDGELITDDDYEKLRNIDPQLEKKIRKDQDIADITENMRLTGKLSKEDAKRLKEIAPEYSKKLTVAIENQRRTKHALEIIQKKLSNGTFGPEDIENLEKINPEAAKIVKASLKEQLNSKVREMESNLKSVKKTIDKGLNNKDFSDLRKQLDSISESKKPFDKKELKKLQDKIKASNSSSQTPFEKVYTRLSLDYDIKNMTGNSKDLKRVISLFFSMLLKINVPLILQRNSLGLLQGLQNIQQWFEAAGRIVSQACDRCDGDCNKDTSLKYIFDTAATNVKMFNLKLCKTKWVSGFKIKSITQICNELNIVEKFLVEYRKLKADLCVEVEKKLRGSLSKMVLQWKDVRKQMESSSKEQWKRSEITVSLLNDYIHLGKMLSSAFSKEIGNANLPLLSKDDILSSADSKKNQSAASLAELKILHISLSNVISVIQKLPNLIKKNGQTTIMVTAEELKEIMDMFKKLTDRVMILLGRLCIDKSVDSIKVSAAIPKLIKNCKAQLHQLLSAKTLSALFSSSNRFHQFAKFILITMEKVKSQLLPCKLRQEKVESDAKTFEEPALKELNMFLENVYPLSPKSVKDMIYNLQDLISQHKDGIRSPIGMSVDLLSKYIDSLPKFSLPMILTLTKPKLAAVVLNSLQENLEHIKNVFVSISEVIKRCPGCTPDDVFGKTNLVEICKRLDVYLKPISKSTSKFMEDLISAPRGLSFITNSMEHARTALQTLWRSDTGLSADGIDSIIQGFHHTIHAVKKIKENDDLYQSLTGLANKNVQDYKAILSKLKLPLLNLHSHVTAEGKSKVVKEFTEKIEKYSDMFSLPESKEKESPLVRRFEIFEEFAYILKDIGEIFKLIYMQELNSESIKYTDSKLIKYADEVFSPEMQNWLAAMKQNIEQLLNETVDILQPMGIILPIAQRNALFLMDLPLLIKNVATSARSRKGELAKEFSLKSTAASNFLIKLSQDGAEILKSKIGGISKNIDSFKRFKQKLERYGDIYDEVQATLKKIKKGPVSKLGEVKDSVDQLVSFLKDYDIRKILSANPKVIPLKLKEMQDLFQSTAAAFRAMDQILAKCKTCNIENVFGYHYIKTLTGNLDQIFNDMELRLNKYATNIGDAVSEMQGMRTAVKRIKGRFKVIFDKNMIDSNALKDLNNAFLGSSKDVTAFEKGAHKTIQILFYEDTSLQVIEGSINSVITQMAEVMNKSHVVSKQAEILYSHAMKMKTMFEKIKVNASKLRDSPLRSRIEVVLHITNLARELIGKIPSLFQLSNETLALAGIDDAWSKTLGNRLESLINSISSLLDKTNRVLKSADIAVNGIEDIHNKIPILKKSLKVFSNNRWDDKIPAVEAAGKQLKQIFDVIVDTSSKSAIALDHSLNVNDLKSSVVTTVGKERIKKFKEFSKKAVKVVTDLQKGPINEIGILTDAIHNFVGELSQYDFGKMILENPTSLKGKLLEFKQLSQTAGDIIEDINSILCKGCDAGSILGNQFIKSFSGIIKKRFGAIGRNMTIVLKRANAGLKGLKPVIEAAKHISSHFDNLDNEKVTPKTLNLVSEALLKSANDIDKLSSKKGIIFASIFNGNNDIHILQNQFENLIHDVSGVLKNTSLVLPKVGDVLQSVDNIRSTFDDMKANLNNVTHGPIESRLNILKHMANGITALSQTLPVIFNQSSKVIASLGVNPNWFTNVAGQLVNVSNKLSPVVNKTNMILDGAGIVIENAEGMENKLNEINEDYKKMLSAPLKDKFKHFDAALGRMTEFLNETHSTSASVEELLRNASGIDLSATGKLDKIVNKASGLIGNLSSASKHAETIYKDVESALHAVKSGPIQKIGKLTDATKEFVGLLKNYDIADILVLGPKFAKQKMADLKVIAQESGTLLGNISSLVKKHCKSCKIDTFLREGFSRNIAQQLSGNLRNFTKKAEKFLNKMEETGKDVGTIINSVKGIKTQVATLKNIHFDEDGFHKIANVLQNSSNYIEEIGTGIASVFRALFNDSADMRRLVGQYEGFITKMRGFMNELGSNSNEISHAFGKLKEIQDVFEDTKSNFESLKSGPLENRVHAVKNIANGVNAIMSNFTELLKTSKMSPKWLRSFGNNLEGITGGISKVLNETVSLSSDIGETLESVDNIIETGSIVKNDFKRLIGSGSVDSKIKIATNIVSKMKTLTGQINQMAHNTSAAFEKMTDITLVKTDIFGNATSNILDGISSGLGVIADRYEKYHKISKSISAAFDKIEDDPVKFVSEDLPNLFNQSSDFINVIIKDIKSTASKVGVSLEKVNIDSSLVHKAESFYDFAQTTLQAIGSGKHLITDFKDLLHSKGFKDSVKNLAHMLKSGNDFIANMDKLGGKLIKNWDKIKGSFSNTLQGVTKSLGINFQQMGGYLKDGLAIGGNALSIVGNIESLLNMKEFNADTLVQAANSAMEIAKAGVDLLNTMGMNIGSASLDTLGNVLGSLGSVVQLYEGIKGFIHWLKDSCDITYENVVIPKTFTYQCLKETIHQEKVKIRIQKCVDKPVKVIRGFQEGTVCCLPKKQCIYMQDYSCLKNNEDCLKNKTNQLASLSEFQKGVKHIFLNYQNYSQQMQAKLTDVYSEKELLKRARIDLQRSLANLERHKEMKRKANSTLKLLLKHKDLIEKVVRNTKSSITIDKVQFDVASYESDVKHIHFKVTFRDQTLIPRSLYAHVNFDKEDASFTNIAQMIVATFIPDYIPLRTKSIPKLLYHNMGSKVVENEDARFWRSVCINYREAYATLKNVFAIISEGLINASDRTNTDLGLSRKKKTSTSLTPSEAVKSYKEEMAKIDMRNTESVSDLLTRWKQSSEMIWSEDTGSPCVGFIDCFNAQLENITALYKPDMKGYDTCLKSIADIRENVSILINTKKLSKNTALQIMKQVHLSMSNLDKNTYFCDESPKLTKQMPTFVFAYLEEDFDLECTIDGPASMEFRWWRNGTLLPTQKSWKLLLQEITKDDGGVYKCEGKTLTSSAMSNEVLIRIYEPMKMVTHPRDHVLNFPGGKEIIFSCNGTAEPNSFYKWWFKPYNSKSPIGLAESPILKLKSANSKNTGQYWCELSNGYSSIFSRKAKLDIVRAKARKESARLNLDLSSNEDDIQCSLPKYGNSTDLIEAIRSTLQSKIGLDKTSEMNVQYKVNLTDESRAGITVNIGLVPPAQLMRMENSVDIAYEVSQGRVELQSVLTNFVDGLEVDKEKLNVAWKNCSITINSRKYAIDYQVDELVCPSGMGPSAELVQCVQCSPGTYDDGQGKCAPCTVGAYQPHGGQTSCFPCGNGMLTVEEGTPTVDGCFKTDYICDSPMTLAIVMDASTHVTDAIWNKMKSFVSRLASRMTLNNEAVKISLISVGSTAKLEVSPGSYKDSAQLRSIIDGLQKIPGDYRSELAMKLASDLSQSWDYTSEKYAVLFITKADTQKFPEDLIKEKSVILKNSGVGVFTVLINQSGEDIQPYLSIVSKPVSKHFIQVRKLDEILHWETVAARSLCNSIHQVRRVS